MQFASWLYLPLSGTLFNLCFSCLSSEQDFFFPMKEILLSGSFLQHMAATVASANSHLTLHHPPAWMPWVAARGQTWRHACPCSCNPFPLEASWVAETKPFAVRQSTGRMWDTSQIFVREWRCLQRSIQLLPLTVTGLLWVVSATPRTSGALDAELFLLSWHLAGQG